MNLNVGSVHVDANKHPVVVIGAGPVGLAAAAHLVDRALDFVVLEAGATVAAAMRAWGHVRLFSPWEYDTDPTAVALLAATGWVAPDSSILPTGAELVERYLEPLAAHPAIAPRIRLNTRVVGVARLGYDKTRTGDRAAAPFVVRVRTPAGDDELLARAVIDASGTYGAPNPLGATGMPAIGEADVADRIHYCIPDPLGRDRARYTGKRVAVVGSGHSAMGAILDLAALAENVPAPAITWAVRRPSPGQMFGGGSADGLPARGSIGARARALVESGVVSFVTGFATSRVRRTADGVVVSDGAREIGPFDEIVCATGFRPDLAPLRELRLEIDPVVESPVRLAPLIDPNLHSCGSVPPHGYEQLRHPEEGVYIVGAKSYGRAPTALMRTGYEQVRSVVAAIAGDLAAARDVRLVLPETGVCSSDPETGVACCAPSPTPSRFDALPALTLGASPSARRRTALPLAVALATAPVTPATDCGCGPGCCGGKPGPLPAGESRDCCAGDCCAR
jgi:glycine/D-amino acid oxidase-like deaminating enzyme